MEIRRSFFSKISYNIRKIYIKNKYYNTHAFFIFSDKKKYKKRKDTRI